MARKPKTQPSTATASAIPAKKVAAMVDSFVPAHRGRKAKAAALTPEMPSPTGDDTATSDVEADTVSAAPVDAPRRKGGRKPKPSEAAAVALLLQHEAGERRAPKSRKSKPEATPDPVEDDVPASEALSRAVDDASGNPALPDVVPVRSTNSVEQSHSRLDSPAPAKSAAHWDRVTDAVQFDWPAIEQIAAQDGVNQGMAKLLVAARAEGANSRWPL